jgi:hypothetical protein
MTPTSTLSIVRTTYAGVFLGKILSTDGDTVVLDSPRRLWYWDGAATLSELAVEGTAKPKTCKFPAPTEGEHTVLGVVEILPVTERAATSLQAVPVWSAR